MRWARRCRSGIAPCLLLYRVCQAIWVQPDFVVGPHGFVAAHLSDDETVAKMGHRDLGMKMGHPDFWDIAQREAVSGETAIICLAGALCYERESILRRAAPARLTIPVPSNAKVDGSGTAEGAV